MATQREKAARLRQLHDGPRLLVLPNAWDVASAKVIAAAGAHAIATSSAGVPLVTNAGPGAFAARGLGGDARLVGGVGRANAYLGAGADGAFVPFVSDREAIGRLAREIRGPLNVLAKPGSPPLAELERLG